MCDGGIDDEVLELTSTWLLVEVLYDREFVAVEGMCDCDDMPARSYVHMMCDLLSVNPDVNHTARALCWLQLELRKKLYLEEICGAPLAFLPVGHDGGILNNGGHFAVNRQLHPLQNRELLFKQCVRYVMAGMQL